MKNKTLFYLSLVSYIVIIPLFIYFFTQNRADKNKIFILAIVIFSVIGLFTNLYVLVKSKYKEK